MTRLPDLPMYSAPATEPGRFIRIGDRTNHGTVTEMRLNERGWLIIVNVEEGGFGALPDDTIWLTPDDLTYLGPALTRITLDVDLDKLMKDLAAMTRPTRDKGAIDRVGALILKAIEEARQ